MPGRYYSQGESIDLDKDFPQIEDITGIVEISPSFGGPQKEVKPFTKSNLPVGYVHCKSSVCNKGGVALGEMLWNLLSRMVKDKKTEDSGSQFCQGYEKMGRGQRRDCRATAATIKVRIKYREPETEKVE
ncbi:MAG TPA: hypothetical protein VEL49_08730 [Ktedonobacteraceae bacterium]|nr:hypothetical protein [Ktedonobacteraceae bacterium]